MHNGVHLTDERYSMFPQLRLSKVIIGSLLFAAGAQAGNSSEGGGAEPATRIVSFDVAGGVSDDSTPLGKLFGPTGACTMRIANPRVINVQHQSYSPKYHPVFRVTMQSLALIREDFVVLATGAVISRQLEKVIVGTTEQSDPDQANRQARLMVERQIEGFLAIYPWCPGAAPKTPKQKE